MTRVESDPVNKNEAAVAVIAGGGGLCRHFLAAIRPTGTGAALGSCGLFGRRVAGPSASSSEMLQSAVRICI